MTWWDKLKTIARREAGAVKEEVGRAAHALDEALAKKERELEATPAERVDMLLDEIADEDAQFGQIEEKLRTKGVERATRAGLDPPVPTAKPEPGWSHIAAQLDVRPVPIRPDQSDKTSHVVTTRKRVAAALDSSTLDAIVADLQVEVMVLGADRRGDAIALRTPTLTVEGVTDLVARVIAAHAAELADPEQAADAPADEPVTGVGGDDDTDAAPEDLAHSDP